MKLKKSKLILLLFLIFLLSVSIMFIPAKVIFKVWDQGYSAQTVVEKCIQYTNEQNIGKLTTTFSGRFPPPTEQPNLDSIKILHIEEETGDSSAKKRYLLGVGKGTAEKNVKVYKVRMEVKYKWEHSGPQESGTYDRWFFVTRKNVYSPWFIDYISTGEG